MWESFMAAIKDWNCEGKVRSERREEAKRRTTGELTGELID